MMKVREIQLNNEGKIIGLKGTFKKDNTSKVYLWATLGIEYAGG